MCNHCAGVGLTIERSTTVGGGRIRSWGPAHQQSYDIYTVEPGEEACNVPVGELGRVKSNG